MPLYVYLAAAAVPLSFPLLWWGIASGRTATAKVAANLSAHGGTDLRQAVLSHSAQDRAIAPLLRQLGERARRLSPGGWTRSLERRLELAGRPSAWPLERIFAMKVILAVGGLLAGFTVLPGDVLMTVVYTAGSYFIPDLVLRSRAGTRQELITRELPDTLDQITIAVEAGLGFENAMARAGRSGTGPLAGEFLRTLQEIQLGSSRSNALRALAERNDSADLRHFVLALVQAEQFGIPLVEVLRIQSKEMRQKRGQRAEERAMKIPVKIVFPLVLCILPVIFIVIIGPAAIGLARILGSF